MLLIKWRNFPKKTEMKTLTNSLTILNIRTTTEQQEWINILEDIIEDNKSETDFNLEKYSKKNLTLIQFNSLEEYLKEFKPTEMMEELQKLKDELTKLPVVNMTIAFDPNSNFVNRVVGIVREKVAAQAVIHLTISKNIIGGFLLDYQGKFYDASLINMIHNLTKEKEHARL